MPKFTFAAAQISRCCRLRCCVFKSSSSLSVWHPFQYTKPSYTMRLFSANVSSVHSFLFLVVDKGGGVWSKVFTAEKRVWCNVVYGQTTFLTRKNFSRWETNTRCSRRSYRDVVKANCNYIYVAGLYQQWSWFWSRWSPNWTWFPL